MERPDGLDFLLDLPLWDLDGRIARVQEYLVEHPHCALAWGILGNTYLRKLGKRAEAKAAFERAMVEDPHDFGWRMGWVQSLDFSQMQSEDTWNTLMPVPNLPSVVFEVLECVYPSSAPGLVPGEGALKLARDNFLLHPSNPESGLQYAKLLLRRRRLEEAADIVERVLPDIPDSCEFGRDWLLHCPMTAILTQEQHENAGRILMRANRLSAAASEFRHALKLARFLDYQPSWLETWAIKTFVEIGEIDEAIALCDEVIAIPVVGLDHRFVQRKLEVLREAGRTDEYVRAYRSALEEQDNEEVWMFVGAVSSYLREQQRWSEARSFLELWLANRPRFCPPDYYPPLVEEVQPEVYLELGRVKQALGDLEGAREAWHVVLESSDAEVAAQARAALEVASDGG